MPGVPAVITPFIRSTLSWQQAMATIASYPRPSALCSSVDLEKAAVDRAAARKWVAFLAFMAKNFENIIVEAAPSCEADDVELEKLRNVLGAIREAHVHARKHVTGLAKSYVPLAFVRSLVHWQHAMICVVSYPNPFALLTDVNLEKASVDFAAAEEWVTFLETVAQKAARLIADARSSLVVCPLPNAEGMLNFVREARRDAEEHVASFVKSTADSDHT